MAEAALAQGKLLSLRETIARMEGKPLHRLEPVPDSAVGRPGDVSVAVLNHDRIAFGIEALDAALGGGLVRSGMAEIRSGSLRDSGASTGLALSVAAFVMTRQEPQQGRAVFFVGEPSVCRETGELLAEGLEDHGLALDRLVYARPRKLDEALWLAEAALSSRAFAVVVLEVAGNPARFGLSESRRLSLKARDSDCLLLLLRQGGREEAGSTIFRLEASPAPSGLHLLPDGKPLRGTIGSAAVSLAIEKVSASASPLPSQGIVLEWNAHERLFTCPSDTLPAFCPEPRPANSGAGLPLPADRSDRPQTLGAVLAFDRAS